VREEGDAANGWYGRTLGESPTEYGLALKSGNEVPDCVLLASEASLLSGGS